MGLDITAYRQLTIATGVEVDESGYPVDYDKYWKPSTAAIKWAEEHFPGRSQGIDRDAIYTSAESHAFRAGSYSGYNAWRNQLAELAGIKDEDRDHLDEGKPFAELVFFADNEGVIGPVVGAKLLRDFQDNLPKAEAIGGYFLDRYRDWLKAFEFAADGGAVEFH